MAVARTDVAGVVRTWASPPGGSTDCSDLCHLSMPTGGSMLATWGVPGWTAASSNCDIRGHLVVWCYSWRSTVIKLWSVHLLSASSLCATPIIRGNQQSVNRSIWSILFCNLCLKAVIDWKQTGPSLRDEVFVCYSCVWMLLANIDTPVLSNVNLATLFAGPKIKHCLLQTFIWTSHAAECI